MQFSQELIWRYECVVQLNTKLTSDLDIAKRFNALPSIKKIEEENIALRKALVRRYASPTFN
jgi:hypothetical protein